MQNVAYNAYVSLTCLSTVTKITKYIHTNCLAVVYVKHSEVEQVDLVCSNQGEICLPNY